MESLYILIPIAVLFVIIAVAIFFWAVRSDQFEDLERQGMNVLLDDDDPKQSKTTPEEKQKRDES
ncbi:cbb3-type cytochrome oxidase assembly protein CcoS [Pseudidiomarina terrestris]|uniref:Cbb3-type cytochrome oxidase assembly protein CcoS n=1 Tax=Pseudidiomarina terrestris TaxID=2820060 RepID=A0AAW7QXU8_9GAMM|nr:MULTISPECIES: cbb3-type cytochrome oxidase assembly protein CcoS [unclassified Pseudidiomarina]MDN7123675.1 cbb3-type cytochrome oxidase assembly protein CcoS [Pseudidiomarina sp. 1APP75-32.1]MDN7126535.1 cbb3-type cytochrome oxidase assembly protein CcoS [Pseudidiomarina sp. 1APR75-33.1]MDN7128601.1 cbb3-type cytochrome oxidase assembly protein CcoS [Pseudidiomarina sp. 1APR75-15]MDN7135140.1 cbb3-type cytochrome oxidase assembly protein CcoS [Pseudidiomarina sp. 1ASP75-5]MDN7137811.1 cbb3